MNEMLELILSDPLAIEESCVPCALKGFHWIMCREAEALPQAVQPPLLIPKLPIATELQRAA